MKKKRVFIGIKLSKELQKEIGEWREKFSHFPMRLIPLEFLHITLVPPWYTENIDEVVSILQKAAKPAGAFSVNFQKVSFGPDVKHPRLIWARGEIPSELIELKTHLVNILKQREEKRTPILHTTLARFSMEQFSQFSTKHLSESIRWKEEVASFALIESHLKRTGAEYETLTEIRL